MINPAAHYDFRLALIKDDQREIRAILRASLTPVQQNEAERRGDYAVLGFCRCGAPADHGQWCMDCDQHRHEAEKDAIAGAAPVEAP